MKLRTQLLLGYALVFVLMALVATVSHFSTLSLLESQTWVGHTLQVISTASELEANIFGMQTAKRGYLISGDPRDLQQYERYSSEYESRVPALESLVGDNPQQVQRVAAIQLLVERWVSETALDIAQRKLVNEHRGQLEDMLQTYVRRPSGSGVVTDAVGLINAFIAVERDLLQQRTRAAARSARLSSAVVLAGTGLATLLGVGVMIVITRRVLRQVGGEPGEIAVATEKIAQGDLEIAMEGTSGIAAAVAGMTRTLKDVARQANVIANGDYSTDIAPRSENDELGIALCKMNSALRAALAESTARDWLKTGLARINEVMQGDLELDVLAGKVVSEVATWLDAKVGALYVAQNDGDLVLMGTYAYAQGGNRSSRFSPGEGLVGQAALEKRQILIREVPENYLQVTSGLGAHVPRFICVTPFLHGDGLKGVLELGTLNDMTGVQLDYLQQAMPALAVAVESACGRSELARALAKSQQLTEKLQAQQEELRVANEELEEQTQRLRASEEELKAQQEELHVSNEELAEKNNLLERQKREVETARRDLATKADELALASRYKSEFLANMSHELRTPLNSLLLLAESLARNKAGNLNQDQLESAAVIYSSGTDLLNLINEILDLSKIEAGRMDLNLAAVATDELAGGLHGSFDHMARDKGLTFETSIAPEFPKAFVTDRKRLEQILRNLIGNAMKFTEHGGIKVDFVRARQGNASGRSGKNPEQDLAIAVSDTGIGIPPEKHQLIFQAFQQVDGTTTRRYGGTGLGLTISRELAELLGGEIELRSEPGHGSTFTLYLPLRSEPAATADPGERPVRAGGPGRQVLLPPTPAAAERIARPYIPDDRDRLGADDWLILIIEDDPKFAGILLSKCHERGFKALAAPSGEVGLELVVQYLPKGIILDLRLPGMDGMAVLAALKDDIRTRHIPVHVVSVHEQSAESLRRGAIGHTVKPLDQNGLERVLDRLAEVFADRRKRVLVVENDARQRLETVQLIASGDVEVDEAGTGAAAFEKLREGSYDCIVLDLRLPDLGGLDLLAQLQQEGVALPPIIVHSAGPISTAEEADLRAQAESIVLKDVCSPERLLDEVSLFLHRVVSDMPSQQRDLIRELRDSDAALRGKKVLVVDDDMRTTFALARLLTEIGMHPLKAENGERALQLLGETPDVDIVLMDVMMPVMDGYETTRRIRAQERFRKVPIIALTAKAMPEDRQKCFDAGASDYLAKPVDTARLFSMMRVWLYR